MSQKKFDYKVTISAEYRRTYSLPKDVQETIEAMLQEEGFKKVKVAVKGITKK